MDKRTLKKYRPNKDRLIRIENQIQELSERESTVVMGKVTGSSADFPYTEVRTSVQMYDPSGYHDLNVSNMPGMIVETLFCTGTGDVARYRNLGTKGIAELIAKAIDSRASACSEQKNNQNTGIEQEGEEEMKCLFTVEGKGAVYYFDGQKVITLGHPDELKIIQKIYKDNNGKDIPCYKWSPKAPWYARLMSVIYSKETTSI